MRARTDYLVVHCSATKPNQDIGATEIDRWHRERGFLRIGYHFVIRRNGAIETGRNVDQPGAHAEGFNNCSVGICLVGGSDANDPTKAEDNFTPEQYETLKSLLLDLKRKYPSAEILGHRDLPKVKKACPAFDVREWVKTNL